MKFSISVETDKFNKHIEQFMKQTEIDTVLVLKKFAIDLLARIIIKTPVDTGRARAGWYPAMSGLGGAAVKTGKPGEVKGESEGSYSTKFEGDEKYIEIINGVPYAIFLEYGHSKQAPYGMVRLSMRELMGSQLPKDMEEKIQIAWNKG